METTKEQWVEQVMNSADDLHRMPVPERLRLRLEAIPTTITVGSRTIPLRVVWFTAACIAGLLIVNITAFQEAGKSSEPSLDAAYFSYLDQAL